MPRILALLTVFIAAVAANVCDENMFVSHPISVEARLGDFVNFTCDISTDTYLHRTFRHYMANGAFLELNDIRDRNDMFYRRAVGASNVANTLMIEGVQSYHAGQYQCFATSDGNNCLTFFSLNATLTIIGEPVISSATEFSGFTTEDLSVTLSITGTDPTVQVYREGVLLVNGPRIEFSFANTQFEMIISDLKQSDAGEYIIKASNDFAKAETTITVIPIGPDRPVVELMDVQVSAYGEAVPLTCSIQPEAQEDSVEFFWRDIQNRVITPNSKFSISSDTMSSTLTINALTSNFTGGYTCVANNSRGSTPKVIILFGPPAPVTNLLIVGTSSSRQRTVTWQQPGNSVEPIQKHMILLYREDEDVVVMQREENSSTLTTDGVMYSYPLTNLNPGSFQLTVTPVSVVGDNTVQGPESARKKFTVDEDTHVVAIAVGAGAGVAVLLAIGTAVGIFCLCFYYPHRRQLQSQQQTWSREDVKTDGAPKNEYTALTLRPSSGYPASPGMSSPTSDQFLANIDPKWEFPRENIKLCDPLCEGQFTVLYKGLATGIKEKPVDVAIKSVRVDATEDDVKALVAEMEMLSSIGPHENIVSMLRVCTVGKPMYMVMEYMCHGDLLGFLRTSRGHNGRYTVSPGLGYQAPAINLYPRDLLNIGAKIANGMRYLADRKLVHRALCAKNVLVGANMSIKIYNVGSFDMTFESRDYIMKWLAPETLFDQTATTYSDVWSFGVALWELVTVGGTPYGEIQPEDLYSQLMNGMRMPCPQHCAQEIHELMLDCWRRNPVDRPHFSVIHEKLEDLANSKVNLLDFQNYDMYIYSQFEEPVALSTVL
ncbi:fibroblast growth factor receptor 3-like [Halichondria panicea]|uniref:fibroblast growth factor receptor 3-like n=1 Tax=Halichondria panicea TaxID=6063 RepID=UPI00312BC230